MFEEARPTENTNYDRKVRENQRNEFKKILEEDQIQPQIAEELAIALEQEAFSLSGGDGTRDYRTRVNTVKMRLKGTKGQLIRTVLVEKIMTPSELMQLDMSKLSEDSVQAFLQKSNKSIPQAQSNIKKPVPPRGPQTRPPVSVVPPFKSNPPQQNSLLQTQQVEQPVQPKKSEQLFREQQTNIEKTSQTIEEQHSNEPTIEKQNVEPVREKANQIRPQSEQVRPPATQVRPPQRVVQNESTSQQQSSQVQQFEEIAQHQTAFELKEKEISNSKARFLEDNQQQQQNDLVMESNDFPNIDELRRNQERLNQLAEQLRSDLSDDGQATEKQFDFTPISSQNKLDCNVKQGSDFENEQQEQIVFQNQEELNDEMERNPDINNVAQDNYEEQQETNEQNPPQYIGEENNFDSNNQENFNANNDNKSKQVGQDENQFQGEQFNIQEQPQDEIKSSNQHQKLQENINNDAFNFQSSQIQQQSQEENNFGTTITSTPKFTFQLQQSQSQEIDKVMFEQMIQSRDQYYEQQLSQLGQLNKDLQQTIQKFQKDHLQIMNDLKQKNLNYQTQIQHLSNENQILKQNLSDHEQSASRSINQLKEQILIERNQYQKLYETQHQDRVKERSVIEKMHQTSQLRKEMINKYKQQQQSSNFDDQISILQSLISKIQPPQVSRVQSIQPLPSTSYQQAQQQPISIPENINLTQHHSQQQQQNQQYWANEDDITLQTQVVNADSGSTQLKTHQVYVQDLQEVQDAQDNLQFQQEENTYQQQQQVAIQKENQNDEENIQQPQQHHQEYLQFEQHLPEGQNEQEKINDQNEQIKNNEYLENTEKDTYIPPPPPRKQPNHAKKEKNAFLHPKLAHKQQEHHEHHQQIQQANPFEEGADPASFFNNVDQQDTQLKQNNSELSSKSKTKERQINRRANVPGSLFD